MADDPNLTVLLCSDYLPPSDGGVENVIRELTESISPADVRIHVFSLSSAPDPDVDLPDDIEVHVAQTVDLRKYLGVQSNVSTSALRQLSGLLRHLDPDVLHLHNRFFFTTASTYVLARLLRFDGSIVTTVHLGDVEGLGGAVGVLAGAYDQTLARLVVRGSDHVVAVSEAAASHAVSLGADPTTTHVVPNAVDTDAFHPADADPASTILFVGRLVRNKGPQDLLEALPALFDRVPGADAVFVGQGPLRKDLQARAREIGVADRVEFRGRVEDVPTVMREAGLFCRPSYTEGLPLTLLEAMATGVPPVVTPVAGVPEVVKDGETGVLVPCGDPETLGDALGDLLANPDSMVELGQNAREYVVANHDWDRRGKRVLEIYRS